MKAALLVLIITLLMGGVGMCEEAGETKWGDTYSIADIETQPYDFVFYGKGGNQEIMRLRGEDGAYIFYRSDSSELIVTGNDLILILNMLKESRKTMADCFDQTWPDIIEQSQLEPWAEEKEPTEISDTMFRVGWFPCGIACPECGKELEMYHENPVYPVYITADQFRCPSCGWEGSKARPQFLYQDNEVEK